MTLEKYRTFLSQIFVNEFKKLTTEKAMKLEKVKAKWIKDIKENPEYMKRIFECNDENSLAGDISLGP
jgi:hypothetical protein